MKKTLLLFLFVITFSLNAQNAGDVDTAIGSGFVGFHTVNDIAVQSDGKVIVGGVFFDISGGQSSAYKLIRLNSNGSIDPSFALCLFEAPNVQDIVIQPDNKILVSGNFTKMNGETTGSILRLNTDGSRDMSFQPGIYNMIYSMALQQDGKIILGGNGVYYFNNNFTNPRKCMIRLNADGTTDTTFDFGSMGFTPINSTATVFKVAVQPDGKILAGGSFTTFNGQNQGKLIRFNSNGTKDTSFDIGTGSTDSGYISDIAIQSDGKILICGGFGSWNGQAYGHLCRLNANGSLDTSFTNLYNTYQYGPREVELQSNGKILAIGDYEANGVAFRVSLFNSNGSHDTSFSAGASSTLYGLAVQPDDKVLIGGFMSWEGNNILKNGIVRLNASNGQKDITFGVYNGLNDEVFSIGLQSDNKTILAGNFTSFDGANQNRIMRVNDNGSKDPSLNIGTGFNDAVKAVAVQNDGKIIVGGNFTQYNGQAVNRLIRLNADGTKDTSFYTGGGFNSTVQVIQIQPNGKILVGGKFGDWNGMPVNYLMRFNPDGMPDPNFNFIATFNGNVNAIAIQPDGKIVVGGSFTEFNLQPQRKLIRLNADGTKDTTFNIVTRDFYNDPTDIAIQADGKIIVPMHHLYRFNADGSVDTNFNNNLNNFSIMMLAPTYTVAVQEDGKILVGGNFTVMNNRTNRIICLNSDGTKDTTFNTGNIVDGSNDYFSSGFTEGACNDIVIQPDKKIWIGGSFFHYRGTSSFSAIRLAGENLLGIEDPESTSNISVYPNPVKDFLNINSIAKSIQAFDISGKFLEEKENTSQMDFSHYSSGIYLVKIELENGAAETKKIIKY